MRRTRVDPGINGGSSAVRLRPPARTVTELARTSGEIVTVSVTSALPAGNETFAWVGDT